MQAHFHFPQKSDCYLIPMHKDSGKQGNRVTTQWIANPTRLGNNVDKENHIARTEAEEKLIKELTAGGSRKLDRNHPLTKVLTLEGQLRSHGRYCKLFHDNSERDSMTDDPKLCLDLLVIHKFLVAKQFRYPVARKYITDWIEWRMTVKPHKIQLKDVWDEYCTCKAYWYGHDKNGLPILTIRPQFHNAKKHCPDKCGLFFTWISEEGTRIIEESGRGKCVAIFDATKITLKNVDLKAFKKITSVIVMYPEVLEYAVVLTSKTFAVLWKLASPFLDSNTKRKIKFLSSTRDLFQFVDREQVEMDLGGTSSFDFKEYLRINFDPSSTV